MTDHIGERACQLAVYMIENRATVRAAAKKFGISKPRSTRTSPSGSPTQQGPVRTGEGHPDTNKAQRHIRGGLATRKKYKGE